MNLLSSLICLFVVFSSRTDAKESAIEELLIDKLDAEHTLIDLKIRLHTDSLVDDFQLFPRTFGKLLHHIPVRSFSLNFVQGAWRWSDSSFEYSPFPQGATLTASISKEYSQKAWRHLTSSLGGLVCSTLSNMDSRTGEDVLDATEYPLPYIDLPSEWTSPVSSSVIPPSTPVPLHQPVSTWSLPGGSENGTLITRTATLPYEPLCTENLSALLKLIPCNGVSGLSSLIHQLTFARAPFKHVTLSGSSHPLDGHLYFTARLTMAIPMVDMKFHESASLLQGSAPGSTFGQQLWDIINQQTRVHAQQNYPAHSPSLASSHLPRSCPLMPQSHVLLSSSFLVPNNSAEESVASPPQSGLSPEASREKKEREKEDEQIIFVPAAIPPNFVLVPNPLTNSTASLPLQSPWKSTLPSSPPFSPPLKMVRTLSPHPVYPSDKRLSRYTLSLSIPSSTNAKVDDEPKLFRLRCLEHFPLFLTPSVSTMTLTSIATTSVPSLPLFAHRRLNTTLSLQEVSPIIDLNIQGPSSLPSGQGTLFSFSLEAPAGVSITLNMDVNKNFLSSNVYRSAADRGVPSGEALCSITPFKGANRKSLLSDERNFNSPATTLIHSPTFSTTMMPLPDFAMIFNSVALGLLGITLHFSGIFKILAGRKSRGPCEELDDGTFWGKTMQTRVDLVLEELAREDAEKEVRGLILSGKLTPSGL
eukprot:GDKJ01021764.1.p1 GENE.GDKJ01021764.1~~GDKJ01021764.1.p1  ORF type:complete len:700 (+),score=141.43 GDKJ01021764.1:27-2126(+)